MLAGLRVAAVKENPLLSLAEKVRKANGCVLAFAASTIASFWSGAAETAASTMHRRKSGEADAPAFAIEVAVSGLVTIATFTIRSIIPHSISGFASQFLTAA